MTGKQRPRAGSSKKVGGGAGVLTPVRRSDEIAGKIIALIYEGRLTPGARLPAERTLSSHLGVSRPVVREALKRLETRGFIVTRSKRGTYVCASLPAAPRSGLEELVTTHGKWFHDINEVRKALDTHAVAAIIGAQTRRQLGQLRRCLSAMERNSDTSDGNQFEKYSRADLTFHQILAKMTGNAVHVYLMDFLAELVIRAIQYSKRVLTRSYGKVNLEVHRSIFAAIESRDVDRVIRSIENHYQFVEREASSMFSLHGQPPKLVYPED